MEIVLDTRFTYTVRGGSITESGRDSITSFIYYRTPSSDSDWKALNPDNTVVNLKQFPDDWAWTWEVKGKGEYVGTFPKRASKYFYKTHQLKSPEAFLARLGDLAKDHTANECTYYFEFVNSIDWRPGDFGDPNSCWWTNYSEARDCLTDNGGLAVRFYEAGEDDDGGDVGKGRAWLAPYKDMYVLFNGYGFNNATRAIAKLLSEFFGLSYKRVDLDNYNDTMYINDDSGYIIGPIDVISTITSVELEMGDAGEKCESCGRRLNEDNTYTTPNGMHSYCESCYGEHYTSCEQCGEDHEVGDMTEADGSDYCPRCIQRYFTQCSVCETYHRDRDDTEIDGNHYCEDCRDEKFVQCEECEEWHSRELLKDDEDDSSYVCDECTAELEEKDSDDDETDQQLDGQVNTEPLD